MRIILEISSEKEIKLPIQYNHILQGFIYNNLSDKDYREFIHSQGYQLDNKKFKFFTYSRLLGKFNLYPRPNEIGFESPVKLVVFRIEKVITDLLKPYQGDFLFLGTVNLKKQPNCQWLKENTKSK
jgi:CRISPR-associated endoribonuclease Cas6